MTLRTTRDGLFHYTEEDGGSDEVSFRELSVTETERLMARVADVHQLLDLYLPGQSEQGVSPRILDELFISWLADSSQDKADAESIATVLGSTFAYYLQTKKPLSWVVAQVNSDEPTLAVTSDALGVTLYPIWSVRKRISEGSAGFFEPIYAVVEEKLHELQH
jgi:hypothetical protein